MAKYRFFQDKEITMTIREYYDIETDSYESAVKMIQENGDLSCCEGSDFIKEESIHHDWWERDNTCMSLTIYNEDEEEIN